VQVGVAIPGRIALRIALYILSQLMHHRLGNRQIARGTEQNHAIARLRKIK